MASRSGVEFRPTLARVADAVRRRIRRLPDLTAPNARIAAFLDSWVQRNFQTEGENVGGWTPFALGGRWIPGVGLDTSAKLLQHTGEMRASFRSFYDDSDVGIGSDLPRSRYHELGTETIPRRRILPEREEVLKPVLEIYNRHFVDIGRKPLW